MKKRKHCGRIRKLIPTLSESTSQRSRRVVSEHLSECEACRAFHARFQKLESILIRSKLQVGEMARQSRMRQSRVIVETTSLARKRAWCLRPVPAGVGAALLAIAGAVVFALFNEGSRVPSTARPPLTRTPMVTRAMAAERSSRTLLGVAEVLRRREAPSLGVPYTPPPLPGESFYPQLAHQFTLESDARLGKIVQSKISLIAPSAPRRESFFPRLLERSTTESNGTLGRILRSRVNLTRRQDI
jgi:hypothetical protein